MVNVNKKFKRIQEKTGYQQREIYNKILKGMKKDDRFSWSSFQNIIRGHYVRSEVAKTAVYEWIKKELYAINTGRI
jgi:hypothetical protein